MTSDTFKAVAGAASLVVAMCITGGAVGASYARADTGSFLSTMDDHGVYYSDAGKVIDVGKAVCAALRAGNHVQTVRSYMQAHGFSANDTVWVISGAVGELCPDMANLVRAEADHPQGKLT
jgi:hypothetical protein